MSVSHPQGLIDLAVGLPCAGRRWPPLSSRRRAWPIAGPTGGGTTWRTQHW